MYGSPSIGEQEVSQPTAAKRRLGATHREAARDVLDSLRRIVRSLRLSARTAELRGVSGAQMFVLQCLAAESPSSVNDLASRTATDQSSVSVVVSRLVSRGLVVRRASASDRRRLQLSLTPAGRALVRSIPQAPQDRLLVALAILSTSELSTLARTLHKVVALAAVAHETPALFFEDEPTPARARRRKVR
jgi:DNA-binding MarR family transcriptional regulator